MKAQEVEVLGAEQTLIILQSCEELILVGDRIFGRAASSRLAVSPHLWLLRWCHARGFHGDGQ